MPRTPRKRMLDAAQAFPQTPAHAYAYERSTRDDRTPHRNLRPVSGSNPSTITGAGLLIRAPSSRKELENQSGLSRLLPDHNRPLGDAGALVGNDLCPDRTTGRRPRSSLEPFLMLTLPQAAYRACVSRQTIHNWIAAGALLATRCGPIWLVDSQELDRVTHLRRPDRRTGRGPALKRRQHGPR